MGNGSDGRQAVSREASRDTRKATNRIHCAKPSKEKLHIGFIAPSLPFQGDQAVDAHAARAPAPPYSGWEGLVYRTMCFAP